MVAVADAESTSLAVAVARAADDKQAVDVSVIDVGEVISIAQVFVVAGAANPRLVRTVADEVVERARIAGRKPLHVEGFSELQWVLVDFGDVVVHVFLDEARVFYDIERLYRDQPAIEWRAAAVRPA
jgi:ribosome-associated protein